jgi:hypothetical protein
VPTKQREFAQAPSSSRWSFQIGAKRPLRVASQANTARTISRACTRARAAEPGFPAPAQRSSPHAHAQSRNLPAVFTTLGGIVDKPSPRNELPCMSASVLGFVAAKWRTGRFADVARKPITEVARHIRVPRRPPSAATGCSSYDCSDAFIALRPCRPVGDERAGSEIDLRGDYTP